MGMLIFGPRAPMLPNYPLTWVKLVIFITPNWFLSKTQKSHFNSIKISQVKNKKDKGGQGWRKLNGKSQKGVKGDKIILIGTWLIAYLKRYEHMGLERCAPLGEVAPSWGGSPWVIEVAPSSWFDFLFDTWWECERGGSPLSTLGSPLPYTWCALLEEAMCPSPWYYHPLVYK